MTGTRVRAVLAFRYAALVTAAAALLAGCGSGLGPGSSESLTGTATVVQDVEALGSQPVEDGGSSRSRRTKSVRS